MAQVLRPLQELQRLDPHPELLVGLGSPDDAAAWKLDDGRALVVTTDFFTPVVDDPYDFGAIAAANALSDLYAMGASPFLALNVAAMPTDLPPEVLKDIFRGGAEKVREAGAVVAGGHTVQDKEPKFGLVALGFCEPEHLLTKTRARPGDLLVLTKPLGTGVTTTALKRGRASEEDVSEAVRWMSRLNAAASKLAKETGVRSATDVTGFGLLGHGVELAEASGVGLRIYFSEVPFLSGARRYAMEGCVPGGTADNREYFGKRVTFDRGIEDADQTLLFDAQTSGGLLLAVGSSKIADFLAGMASKDIAGWVIGLAEEGQAIRVEREAPRGFPG